jgi:hypothetical protein
MSAQYLKGKISEATAAACTYSNAKCQRLNSGFSVRLQDVELLLFVRVCILLQFVGRNLFSVLSYGNL